MTSRFPQITLLHGRGELPDGSVERLEAILRPKYDRVDFARPYIPDIPSGQAFGMMKEAYGGRLQPNSLIIGFERGGLLACALQSAFPVLHLSAVAINAPAFDISLRAEPCQNGYSRVALYSSVYAPIADRCDWMKLTPMAFNVPWLSDGVKEYYPIAYLVDAFIRGQDMDKEVSLMFPPPPFTDRKPFPGV
jgi:hypothetical protein